MKHYDLAVIGGGPAGMIAAGRAGELGASVILIERNLNLGKKLLLTGKGRCNITNKTDQRTFVKRIGPKGDFLFSSLSKFGINDTIRFFQNHGLEIKVERGKRVFPVSDHSYSVLNVLVSYLNQSKVDIRLGLGVKNFIKKNNIIEGIISDKGDKISADNYLIATGGKSYPQTGSKGDGYRWLRRMGHTIHPLYPSLVPIVTRGNLAKKLEGLSLKNVEITIYHYKEKFESKFGEALFTSNGMSGPIILDLSRKLSRFLAQGEKDFRLEIDFKPALNNEVLDKRIQRDFSSYSNKMFKNSLGKLLPRKLIPVIIQKSGIPFDKKANFITKEERRKLVFILKHFSLEIRGVGGYNKAIVTGGGVDLDEIDQRTMKSKKIDNLYLAGEILDLDGPTGGYSLQICWTTGYVAGQSIASKQLVSRED